MGILSGLGRWLGPAPATDPAIRQAIERALATVGPLLKSVSGCQRKLAPAVSHAMDYCAQLAAGIPGPIEVSSRAFSTDPLVHAMFAASADIDEMLGKSREVRDFLADPAHRAGDELFALLGMRQREKAVMGMALQGDMVQDQVPQRLLYFADHTLGELGSCREMTRERLQAAAFDGLAQSFAVRVAEWRQELEDSRIAWRAEQAAVAGSAERRQAAEARQRLATEALAPERLLEAFAEWLLTSESRLHLKPTVVTVDRMGVISRTPSTDGNFSTLSFPELVGRDRRHWIVVLAKIARQDAEDALRRRQESNRYLII